MSDYALTIGSAARLARVPPARLRAWERAGLLEPARSPAGYRIYGKRDLQRIEFLKDQLNAAGRLGVHALTAADAREPQVAVPAPAAPGSGAFSRGSVGTAYQASAPDDPSLARVAHEALTWAQPHLGGRWCAVALPRPGDQRLAIVAVIGQPALLGHVLGSEEGRAWERFLGTSASAHSAAPPIGDAGATKAAPLVVHGSRGALVASPEADTAAVDACAGAVQLVLQQAGAASQAGAQFRRWQREIAAIHAIVRTLGANPDRDAALQVALEHVLRVLDVEAGTISVLDRGHQQFVLAAHHGCSSEYVAGLAGWGVTEGIGGRAFLSKEALVVPMLSADPRVTRDTVRREDLRAWACMPLMHQGEALGLMETMSVTEHQFSAADMDFLRLVGDQLAVVVARAELKDQLTDAELERARLVRGWAQQLTEAHAQRTARLSAVLDEAVIDPLGSASADEHDPAVLRQAIASALAGATVLGEAIDGEPDSTAVLRILVDEGLFPMTVGLPGTLDVQVRAWPSRLSIHVTARLYDLMRAVVLDALRDRGADSVDVTLQANGRVLELRFVTRWPLVRVAVDQSSGVDPGILRRVQALRGRSEQTRAPGIDELRVVVPRAEEAEAEALTDRQVAVLRALARGLSRRQAAETLEISEKTVQNHLTAAYRRLGAHNRTQAIANALRAGVLTAADLVAPDADDGGDFCEPSPNLAAVAEE